MEIHETRITPLEGGNDSIELWMGDDSDRAKAQLYLRIKIVVPRRRYSLLVTQREALRVVQSKLDDEIGRLGHLAEQNG
jgi:hypothetical protein